MSKNRSRRTKRRPAKRPNRSIRTPLGQLHATLLIGLLSSDTLMHAHTLVAHLTLAWG